MDLWERECGTQNRFNVHSAFHGTSETLPLQDVDFREYMLENGAASFPLTVEFSHCALYFATSHSDHSIRVFSTSSLRMVCSLLGHARSPRTLAFHKTGRLASASMDGDIKLWDPVYRGNELRNYTLAEEYKFHGCSRSCNYPCVSFLPSGNLLIVFGNKLYALVMRDKKGLPGKMISLLSSSYGIATVEVFHAQGMVAISMKKCRLKNEYISMQFDAGRAQIPNLGKEGGVNFSRQRKKRKHISRRQRTPSSQLQTPPGQLGIFQGGTAGNYDNMFIEKMDDAIETGGGVFLEIHVVDSVEGVVRTAYAERRRLKNQYAEISAKLQPFIIRSVLSMWTKKGLSISSCGSLLAVHRKELHAHYLQLISLEKHMLGRVLGQRELTSYHANKITSIQFSENSRGLLVCAEPEMTAISLILVKINSIILFKIDLKGIPHVDLASKVHGRLASRRPEAEMEFELTPLKEFGSVFGVNCGVFLPGVDHSFLCCVLNGPTIVYS